MAPLVLKKNTSKLKFMKRVNLKIPNHNPLLKISF